MDTKEQELVDKIIAHCAEGGFACTLNDENRFDVDLFVDLVRTVRRLDIAWRGKTEIDRKTAWELMRVQEAMLWYHHDNKERSRTEGWYQHFSGNINSLIYGNPIYPPATEEELCLLDKDYAAALVIENGKILLVRRASFEKRFPNAYALPESRRMPGESIEECAKMIEWYYIGRFDDFTFSHQWKTEEDGIKRTHHFFTCRRFGKVMQPPDIIWATVDDIKGLEMPPEHKEAALAALENSK